MKKLILLLLLHGIYTTSVAQESRTYTSEIKEVTVFLQGAQVTREFNASLQKGKNKLVLVKLPSRIKEKSIQVSTKTNGVKVLSVNTHINYLEEENKSEHIGTLQAALKKEKEQLSKATSMLQVYLEEESLIKQNKNIGGSERGVNVEDLKALAQYYQERLTEIAVKKLELQSQIEEHNQRIGTLQSQISILHGKASKPQRELIILTEASAISTGKFQISYTVDEAGWIPSYDLRADQVNQPIKITYKAGVYQNTGEDWKNVKLTFSNADPSVSGQAPYLTPWYLGFNNSYRNIHTIMNDRITGRIMDSNGNALPGVNIVIKGTTVGTVTDINGYYELPLTSGASDLVVSFIGFETKQIPIAGRNVIDLRMNEDVVQLSEVVVTGYGNGAKRQLQGKAAGVNITEDAQEERVNIAATPVVRHTTFEFEVDEPYSIKSTGQRELIDLVEYNVNTQFDYFSVPKMLPSAFLTARLTDWESFNFLSGEASLFFEGKFIGKTVLDVQDARDTLTLSLGMDKSVVVQREKMKNYNTKAFIGSTQKELKAFKISVKNNKSTPVEIVVEDQVPLSTTEDIKVEIIEKSNAEYNAETGKLKWKLTLKPGEHINLDLQYEVKYPKNQVLALE